ncbi:hypothetical protein MaudCBS49596_006072 [Microsporum audouinii]
MQFVQKYTTIPVPRVTKVYMCGKKQHLVMDAVDGQTLDSAWPDLTEEQRLNIVQEFTAFIQQLRGLVPPKEGTIGSTSLGPGYDHRLGDRHFGPFNNIADFHLYVRRGVSLEFWDEPVKQVHDPSRSYAIKYSHADICPNNVLVKNGKIVAIIDWEFAGWYPEYWEYTKIHYGWRPYRKEFYDALGQTMTTLHTQRSSEQSLLSGAVIVPFTMTTLSLRTIRRRRRQARSKTLAIPGVKGPMLSQAWRRQAPRRMVAAS